MPLTTCIRDQFRAARDALEIAQEVLPEPILQSAQAMTDCFMREGRVLVCGDGAPGRAARHLAALLTDRLEQDRPGLAAIFLDGVGMGDGTDPARGSRRQLEAFAHAGDVLVAFSLYGEDLGARGAVQAAQERGLLVVAFSGGDGGPLAEMLREEDILICAPGESAARVLEIQLLAVHSPGACIDYLLLGA